MSTKKNRFADRLGQLRTEKQLTLEELGKIFGKSRATMGHYINGLRSPDIDDLLAIAKYFNVSVSYLIGETDERQCEVYHTNINNHDLSITYRPGDMDHEFDYNDALKVIEKLRSIGVDVDAMLK